MELQKQQMTPMVTIKFPEINYDKEGTYTYKLKEVAGNEAGVTYDSKEHTVTVT